MALTKVQGEGISGVSISANNEITMPSQPAFSVHKNGTSQANIVVGTTDPVTFGTERFDVNSDFNTSTSVFTAPVTGKYLLSASLRFAQIDTVSDYIIVTIQTSNQGYKSIVDPTDTMTGDPDWHTMSVTVLADMDAGDTAKIKVDQSSGSQQTDIEGNAQYTFFTGYLVC